MGVVAGVDSSTQSCTVELRDAQDGTLLGVGRAPHPATTPPVSEQTVDAWWSAFEHAFAAALADAGVASEDVRAISVAAQCHGLVALDADGRALRPVKLWNDTTSSPQASRMVAELGTARWADAVGSVPTAAFTITKLAWVAEHEPELLDRVATVLLPHDYLTWRLTGRAVTDRSEASGTGYYAAHEGRWLPELLTRFVSDRVEWQVVLPEVLGPDEPAGRAVTADARRLGLREDVVVGPGAGDQHAGALGIGLRPHQVLYSLGTSGVVMTTSPGSVHDHSGWVNGVADAAGGYLPLVCTLNCTKVTDFAARLLGVDLAELSRLALAAPSRDDRPVLVAFLDGERSPALADARGLLGGLRSDTTREEVARAAFEGVLLGLVRGQRAIEAAGPDVSGDVLVVGGGSRSPAYRQLLADLLGRPVHQRDVPEATARGACVQAAAVLHEASVVGVRDEWQPPDVGVNEPREPVSDAIRERYLDLARCAGDHWRPDAAVPRQR